MKSKETFLAIPIFNDMVYDRYGHLAYGYSRGLRDHSHADTGSFGLLSPFPCVASSPLKGVPNMRMPKVCRRLSLADKRQLSHILNAVSGGWISMWPKSQFRLRPTGSDCQALSALRDLHAWIIRTFPHDPSVVKHNLKNLANWLRFLASDQQLAEPPKKLISFPFANSEGELDLSKLFRGSIQLKANSTLALASFARFARALPAGRKKEMDRAEKDHLKLLVHSPFETPEEILPLVTKIVSHISPVLKLDVNDLVLSNSSCYERNRAHGGSSEEIKEMFIRQSPYVLTLLSMGYDRRMASRDYIRDPSRAWMTGPFGQQFGTDGYLAHRPILMQFAHRTIVEQVFFEGQVGRRPVKHKVVPIPDRGGFKVRIVTAGESGFQTLAQVVRKVMYSDVLTRIPTKWSLDEDGLDKWLEQVPDIEEMKGNYPTLVLLSSDLSSATDRFPFDFVEAVNDGFESKVNKPNHPNWVAWRSLSGEQELTYDRAVEGTFKTVRGNLMGTAPSWVHLNMYNIILLRISFSVWFYARSHKTLRPLCRQLKKISKSFKNVEERSKVLLPQIFSILSCKDYHPFIWEKNSFPRINKISNIMGDDLMGIMPSEVALLYEIFIHQTGGKTSPGKHYVQPVRKGNYILFAEETLLYDGKSLTKILAPSVRSFINPNEIYDTRSYYETWSQIGPGLRNAIIGLDQGRTKALLSFSFVLTEHLRIHLIKSGLPVYMPSQLGGLGWPHPMGDSYGISRTDHSFVNALIVIRGFRSDIFTMLKHYAALRSTYIKGKTAVHYLQAYNDVLEELWEMYPIAKNKDGAYTTLSEDLPIGLKSSTLETESLFDYIERSTALYISYKYMCDLESETDSNRDEKIITRQSLYKSITSGGKKLGKLCQSLIRLRSGSDLFRQIREPVYSEVTGDLEFISSFHILKDRSVLPVIPTWEEPVADPPRPDRPRNYF